MPCLSGHYRELISPNPNINNFFALLIRNFTVSYEILHPVFQCGFWLLIHVQIEMLQISEIIHGARSGYSLFL